jgi:hypothetical protein
MEVILRLMCIRAKEETLQGIILLKKISVLICEIIKWSPHRVLGVRSLGFRVEKKKCLF